MPPHPYRQGESLVQRPLEVRMTSMLGPAEFVSGCLRPCFGVAYCFALVMAVYIATHAAATGWLFAGAASLGVAACLARPSSLFKPQHISHRTNRIQQPAESEAQFQAYLYVRDLRRPAWVRSADGVSPTADPETWEGEPGALGQGRLSLSQLRQPPGVSSHLTYTYGICMSTQSAQG